MVPQASYRSGLFAMRAAVRAHQRKKFPGLQPQDAFRVRGRDLCNGDSLPGGPLGHPAHGPIRSPAVPGAGSGGVLKSEGDYRVAHKDGGGHAQLFVQGGQAAPESRPVYAVVVHERSGVDKLGRGADAFGRGTLKPERVPEQQGKARPDRLAHEIKVVPAVVVNGFVHAGQQRVYFPVYAGEGSRQGSAVHP